MKFISVIDDTPKKSSTKEAIKSIGQWTKRKLANVCTKKTLYKRLPILTWLPTYNLSFAIGDFVAGITVGLTLIPQALAYAGIAGLPTQYGLYGSFLGCFVYIIFGSCKDVAIGPTAIAALLTFQVVDGRGPEYAVLLCFLTGLVQVLMGIFGLAVSQGYFKFIGAQQIGPKGGELKPNKWQVVINKTLWLIGTARNAILVVVCGFIGYALSVNGPPPFQVIGSVPPGLPTFNVPPFGFEENNNGTVVSHTFFEMLSNMGSGIIIVPLIGLLEDVAICKAFCKLFFVSTVPDVDRT
ncbi:hypothetical protein NQ314_019091 [Rhamnusium bicolor]|uniref:SLC26A/SulP transporter domain-containing protein n=1 Tax=Rhamnusium bicolor TaxID=1586634 RepID=A0AAV8WNK2_9CUCU|nr:hypothetical protein NQ314_019091 [Rhamnusium bicolor]